MIENMKYLESNTIILSAYLNTEAWIQMFML